MERRHPIDLPTIVVGHDDAVRPLSIASSALVAHWIPSRSGPSQLSLINLSSSHDLSARTHIPNPFSTHVDPLLRNWVPLSETHVNLFGVVRERHEGFGLRLFTVPGHENGIGEAVLAAVGVDEKEISRLGITRAPADGHGVEGDDQSRVVIFLGLPDDRQRDIVAVRPEEQ